MTTDSLKSRIGTPVPSVPLQATNGDWVDLSKLSGTTVVYAYPRTSPPNEPPIEGWDQIPGARGCTPQSCAFRDHYADLLELGVIAVFGLSTQSTDYQAEMAKRLHLPFSVLSDGRLTFSEAVGLPTFEAGGLVLLQRLTLVLKDGAFQHIIFPVSNPAGNADDVIRLLKEQ